MRKQRRDFFISKFLPAALLAAVMLVPAGEATAEGTAAGTAITNQATVTYVLDDAGHVGESNIITTQVAELLNVNVVWQDAANIVVSPGDSSRVLTFRVSNTGNGTDDYVLGGLSALGGDDFDPVLVTLYLDIDSNSSYDPAVDEEYRSGINDPSLAADAGITVFVLNDIPIDATDGELGNSQLAATSKTGAGAPGTVIEDAGDGGTDAVIGGSGGRDDDIGTYVVSTASVSVEKSATVVDPSGGSSPVSGADITYTLVVNVFGSGTALGVVLTDSLPADTTYNPGTLTLNGAPLTDEADADAGDVGATTPGVVTVSLGDLAVGSPAQTITFDVKIN